MKVEDKECGDIYVMEREAFPKLKVQVPQLKLILEDSYLPLAHSVNQRKKMKNVGTSGGFYYHCTVKRIDNHEITRSYRDYSMKY